MIKKKHLFLLFLTAALTVLTAQAQAQEKIFSEAEAIKALENWEQKLFEEEMCSHMKDDWLDQFFLNDELENDGLISGKCPFSLLQRQRKSGAVRFVQLCERRDPALHTVCEFPQNTIKNKVPENG